LLGTQILSKEIEQLVEQNVTRGKQTGTRSPLLYYPMNYWASNFSEFFGTADCDIYVDSILSIHILMTVTLLSLL